MTAGVVSDNMQWRSLNAPFNEQGNSLVLRDIETLFLGLQQVQAALGVNTSGAPTNTTTSLQPPANLPPGSSTGIPNPLPVPQGGTGVQTITGYAKGAGIVPFTGVPLIPRADLDNGIGRSVIGRAAGGTGPVADIAGGAQDTIFGSVVGGNLAFSSLAQYFRWSNNLSSSFMTSVGAGSGTLVNGTNAQFCVLHGVGAGAGADPTITTTTLGYISSAAGIATNTALNQKVYSAGGKPGGGFIAIFQVNGSNIDYTVGSKGSGGASPSGGGSTIASISGASPTCIATGGATTGLSPESGSIGSFYIPTTGKLLLFVPLIGNMPDPAMAVVYTTGIFGQWGRGGNAPCFFGRFGTGGNCDGGTGDGTDGRLFYNFY